MKLQLNNVRLNWTDKLKKAEEYNGNVNFGCEVIFDKDSPLIARLKTTIEAVGKDLFSSDWDDIKEILEQNNKIIKPKKGNLVKDKDTKKVYPAYKDKFFLRLNRPERDGLPKFYLRQADSTTGKPKQVSVNDSAYPFYNGCYANVLVDVWGMKGEYKFIAAKLLAVQFFEDGEKLGGAREEATDDDFEAYEPANDFGSDEFGDDIPY